MTASSKDDCIDLDLVAIDGEKIKKDNITTITNKKDAEKLQKKLQEFKEISISSIKTSERKLKPKAPFKTASLQQAAYSTLSFSVKQTSAIAQRLYQGVDLGDGETVGLISYMRTDSTTLSDDCLNDINSFLKKEHPKFLSSDKICFEKFAKMFFEKYLKT